MCLKMFWSCAATRDPCETLYPSTKAMMMLISDKNNCPLQCRHTAW